MYFLLFLRRGLRGLLAFPLTAQHFTGEAEAPSHGQSIVAYDKASRGSVAYLGLAGEVLRRQRERDQAAKANATAPKENAA